MISRRDIGSLEQSIEGRTLRGVAAVYNQHSRENRARTERTVRQAKLVEVSIVVDAAYPQTSSSLRHVDAAAMEAARARLKLHLERIKAWNS
jgi:phage head maturation protease